MKIKLYFIVLLMIFMVSIFFILMPMWRFQASQYRQIKPADIRLPDAPNIQHYFIESALPVPKLEERMALAAEPDPVKTPQPSTTEADRLLEAKQAAQGYLIKVPLKDSKQAQTLIEALNAKGWYTFTVATPEGGALYIGPLLSEQQANGLADKLPLPWSKQASVEGYLDSQ